MMAFDVQVSMKMDVNKNLLRELPYYGVNIVVVHGLFNNSASISRTPNVYLEKLHSLYDLDLFSLNTGIDTSINSDSNILNQHNSPESFLSYFNDTVERFNASGKPVYIAGDFNIDVLKSESCNYVRWPTSALRIPNYTPNSVIRPFLSLHSCLLGALHVVPIRRNFK